MFPFTYHTYSTLHISTDTIGADEIWKECTKVTFIYLANFLIFYKVLRGDFPDWIPVTYYPVMLYVYIVYLTLWKLRPWSKLNASWRSGFINTITAPVGKVNFLANYIGTYAGKGVDVYTGNLACVSKCCNLSFMEETLF